MVPLRFGVCSAARFIFKQDPTVIGLKNTHFAPNNKHSCARSIKSLVASANPNLTDEIKITVYHSLYY